MSLSLFEMENRIERIQEGFEVQAIDLVERTTLRIQITESYLESLKDLLGNKDSDPMIKTAIAYLECDIDIAKNEKTTKLLNELGNVANNDELQILLETYWPHLDSVETVREKRYQYYDFELSRYAKAHDIKEKFYGPNLQAIEKDIK